MLAFSLTKISYLLTHISWVDVVTLLFIAWGLFVGIRKGLEVEFPKFIELAVANIFTLHYYKSLGLQISERLSIPLVPVNIAIFVLTVLGSIMATKFFFKLLGTMVTIKFSDVVAKFGGALFAVSRCLIFLSLFSYFIQLLPFKFLTSAYSAEQSWAGPFLWTASENFYRIWIRYFPLPQL